MNGAQKPEASRLGPLVIEVEGPAAVPVSAAPEVPDMGAPLPAFAKVGTARGWRLGGWLIASAASLVTFMMGLAAWTYLTGLLASHPLLGLVASVLFATFLGLTLVLALREILAFGRLARIDRIRAAAGVVGDDLGAAQQVVAQVARLYHGRAEVAWGAARFGDVARDVMDAPQLLALAEAEFLAPLDQLARHEIEGAVRQVAAVTAIVPLALADVAIALLANLRMVRRLAEIYGGRAGVLGSWRLMRAVMMHLVATGAVAVGDDMIHSLAGGGLLSKLSRRFGEGVINGALTARVGVAALEVCRPMPFAALPRPKVTNLVSRALKGLFGVSDAASRG